MAQVDFPTNSGTENSTFEEEMSQYYDLLKCHKCQCIFFDGMVEGKDYHKYFCSYYCDKCMNPSKHLENPLTLADPILPIVAEL